MLYNINYLYKPIEGVEISGGSNILCELNEMSFLYFSSIYLTLWAIKEVTLKVVIHVRLWWKWQTGTVYQWTIDYFTDAVTTSQVSKSAFSVGRGDDERVATVARVKARRHSHGSPSDKNQATGVNNNNLNIRGNNFND